jgi:23S rRNA (pseudouridine1915-N3)-methyltransferase
MIKIRVLTVGKVKESWLDEALEEYTQRLKPVLSLEWILLKTDEQLSQNIQKEPHYICLDPQGKAFSSEQFSKYLLKEIEQQGARLSFVIGGAEGLNPVIKKKAGGLISLSPLTFTHQLTRLILLEQLYRAFEIEKGSPYHK